jgi:hypothetical protein
MSPVIILYAAILLVAVAALLTAYRVLGTPSRLAPADYTVVLNDVVATVSRSAIHLRDALDAGPGVRDLDQVAASSRKIFQTGYYQTLRLRPASGNDPAVSIRESLGRACEAYDWASRILGSSSVHNPMILVAARGLLSAADAELSRAARELAAVAPAGSGNGEP